MSDDKIVKLHGHDDPELEALYQQADKPAPPAHLDAVIKQAAREEHAPRKTKLAPWFAGIAASVLVGVLFIRLYPTALPPHPASYLEQESGPATMPAAETITPVPARPSPALTDSLRDMPVKAGGNVQMNQVQQAPDTYDQATESKREMRSSPAMKSLGSAARSTEEADIAPGPSAEYSALSKQDDPPQAEAMLEHILELLDQGKTEDAIHAYQEFRQQYPDHIIEPATAARLENLR